MFFSPVFSSERTRPAAIMKPPCLIFVSTSDDAVSCLWGKKRLRPEVRTGCHGFNSLSVCLSVRLCVCVTFVVHIDCESCTRPISTNPGYVEAGKHGLTHGTCIVARRLEVVAVAGLLLISWCVSVG